MKNALQILWVILRRPLQIVAGILLILLGIIGLILPVMPGWIFFPPGIYLIGPSSRPARFLRKHLRRLRAWTRRRRGSVPAGPPAGPAPGTGPTIPDPARERRAN